MGSPSIDLPSREDDIDVDLRMDILCFKGNLQIDSITTKNT